MDAKQAIRLAIETGQMVSLSYLNDLTDEEMMKRPAPGSNHIKWQLGHLIASENMMIGSVVPNAMPALPEGFTDQYRKDNATNDDPAAFHSKAELMKLFEEQRAGTFAALEKAAPEDFDQTTGVDYAPTVGSMFSMQGSHWLMHAGQWAVIRRQLGRAPVI